MQHSKRFLNLKNKIKSIPYLPTNAIDLLKNFETCNFIESVEAHIALNLINKNINYNIRSQLVFPYATGKKQKIAIFDDNLTYLNLGADFVGIDPILNQIESGKINFDILITTPLNMPKLLKFGKILGPRGLMPNLNLGTITLDLKESLFLFKNGKTEYRTDKNGIVHIIFGKLNFPKEHLLINLRALYLSVLDAKPLQIRGKYIKSFSICSTMSPSIFIEISSFKSI